MENENKASSVTSSSSISRSLAVDEGMVIVMCCAQVAVFQEG